MNSTLRRTWAEIDLDALAHNYHALRRQMGPHSRFLGVVKADASGHGSLQVGRTLEELAVDLACQRMTEDELEELKKTQELFAQAIREGDAMRIAQTDERYHEIIYGSTKNEKLVQILNNLREQMYRYRLEYIKDEDKRHILLVEHDQILKALSLRHVHEAKIAIREHIDNQEITILKNLKEQENDVQRKVSGRRNPV